MLAAFAVPIFGGRDAADAPPAAILEVSTTEEQLAFSDFFIATGTAAHAAGLRVSFNHAFSFAPATVRASGAAARAQT